MARQIETFLNSISKDLVWRFNGDGCGDFEEHSEHATKECLENYLLYLEEQKNLTHLAIKELYPKEQS